MKTLIALFAFSALAGAQTQLTEAQLRTPPTTFTAIRVETPAGVVRVQPDNTTFAIDTQASPPVARCIVPAVAGPQGPQGADGATGATGPQGPAGPGTAILFRDDELPVGTIDGTNRVYTLDFAPSPASSLVLHRNGLKQKAGLDFDLSGNTVKFMNAATPQSGDTLEAAYRF